MTYQEMVSYLKTSEYSISKYMKELGLTSIHSPRGNTWSESEDDIIKKHYQDMDIDDLQKLLPNRNIASIQQRASKLGLNKHKCKCRCIETGEIFNSISDAEKWIGCGIRGCLRGEKKTAGGYHWEYIEG